MTREQTTSNDHDGSLASAGRTAGIDCALVDQRGAPRFKQGQTRA